MVPVVPHRPVIRLYSVSCTFPKTLYLTIRLIPVDAQLTYQLDQKYKSDSTFYDPK